MLYNVPPALCWWGFLLLMLTNIPKSLEDNFQKKQRLFEPARSIKHRNSTCTKPLLTAGNPHF